MESDDPGAEESATRNDGNPAGLSARARSIYGRLRIVAQLLRDAPPGDGPRLLWRGSDGKIIQQRLIDGPVVIGRAQTCQVVLSGPCVSRRHCRVWLEKGAAWVQDLRSTAGTIVNGEVAVDRRELCDGDLLDLGGVPVGFVGADEAAGSGGSG